MLIRSVDQAIEARPRFIGYVAADTDLPALDRDVARTRDFRRRDHAERQRFEIALVRRGNRIRGGKKVIVHRKGATPAGPGVLGVIPGSMADPAFIVRGKGNAASLESASHGAGRRMSRTAAREKYNFRAVQKDLEQKGISVLSAGSDEVPYVYKDIREVMAADRKSTRLNSSH